MYKRAKYYKISAVVVGIICLSIGYALFHTGQLSPAIFSAFSGVFSLGTSFFYEDSKKKIDKVSEEVENYEYST